MIVQATTTPTKMGARRFLSLLFGQLPIDREYTNNSGEWSEALLQLCDRHEEYESLFEELGFSRKPGRRPYSRQVSQFLLRLQAGTVVEVINPGIARLRIRPKKQKELYDWHARRVDEGILAIIGQLSAELARNDILAASSAN